MSRDILKLGDKTLAFGEKSFDYAKANPMLVPPYLDMGMFENDMLAQRKDKNEAKKKTKPPKQQPKKQYSK